MIDFHVHCDYSIDADGSVEEYALSAISRGIDYLCFTTHCDLDPSRRDHDGRVRLRGQIVDVTSSWVERYVDDVRSAKQRFAESGLKILCGLEIGYVPGIEDLIVSVIASFDFDYILAGVHTLNGIDISSPREAGLCFGKISCDQFLKAYYSYIETAIESGLFDCIAHIDGYKILALEYYGSSMVEIQLDYCWEALSKMAQKGVALELNSKPLRKGLDKISPDPRMLWVARRLGVKMISMGSDCHHPLDVGEGLDACVDSALSAGFKEVCVWQNRTPLYLPLNRKEG